MIKEIQYAGYSTEPSDYECADGQLATSLNLINEDNQLKPLFQPAAIMTLPDGMAVKCIHYTTDAERHYIIISAQNVISHITQSDIDSEQTKPIPAQRTAQLISVIQDFDSDSISDIKPVGNTLVILAASGVHYILWDSDGDYNYLGQKPPALDIRFGLSSQLTCFPKDKPSGSATVHDSPAHLKQFIDSVYVDAPFVSDEDAWVKPKDSWTPGASFQSAWDYSLDGNSDAAEYVRRWTDFALGNVNRLINDEATSKGKFVFPFLVRWAYELSDGSLIMHSDPVLLIPNSKYPFFAMSGRNGMELQDVGNDNRDYRFYGRAYAFVSQITARILNDTPTTVIEQLRTKWKDIVRRVSIFVSAPIYTYKQDGKVCGWTNMDDNGDWDDFYTEGEMTVNGTTQAGLWTLEDVFPYWNENSAPQGDTDLSHRYFHNYDSNHTMPSFIFTMPEKNNEEILRDIETGSFYKIKSYDITDSELVAMTLQQSPVQIEEGVLASLQAHTTMADDYHSRDILMANRAFIYNSRVNLTKIKRNLHAPLRPDCSWPFNDSVLTRRWKTTVQVKINGKVRIMSSPYAYLGCNMPRYVFYPERHADTIWLQCTEQGTTKRWRLQLTEHPYLEGAYWCAGLQPQITIQEMNPSDEIPDNTATILDEPNKIYTSKADNPFFFPMLGINTVGTGTILDMSAAAKAMSQGQFGQFPLYAFTTEGVWALEVSSNGSYSARQNITRDVCINPDSITQIDSSVLFATDRGIMLISGSQTQCITDGIFSQAPFNVLDLPGIDQLHTKLGHNADACLPTKPFLGFLAGCQMVYDYVHQRIFVFNPATETVNGVTAPLYTYAYVFSLKSKMWGMTFSSLKSTINSYPDALAMTHDNKLVSFSETDETVCKGLYITRPLKLEAANIHKTISALIQRGHFQRGDVGTVLYGSRDLYDWHIIWSSKDQYLRGFRGTPYKYFRIAGIASLTDGKSVFGASVDFEPRHTNQIR